MINTFEQKQRRRLLEMRGRLDAEINRMLEAIQEESAPPGEHERGAPSESIDKEIYLEHAEENIHRAVIAALDRIDRHAYGKCAACGNRIPHARLDAIPYAQRCVKCEQHVGVNHEDQHHHTERASGAV